MFPQLRKLDNESGIVLFIVLMTAIIIMLFALGILTQSINEINYAQQQIDQIETEELSKGIFWNFYSYYSDCADASAASSYNVLEGRNYASNIAVSASAAGGSVINVTTNYDTFQ